MLNEGLKTEAIERLLGPHYKAEMHRRFNGNSPERVGWVAQRLWLEREHLMEWAKLLKEAEAELDALRDLADPPCLMTVSPTEAEAREISQQHAPNHHDGEQP